MPHNPHRAPKVTLPKARKKTKEELNQLQSDRVKGKPVELAYPKSEKQDCSKKNNKWDMSELYSSRSCYTAQQKLQAVTAYVMTGTVRGSARITGLTPQLISEWKNKSSWWPDAYAAVKVQKQEEMDGIMTSIIHFAGEEVVDRLLNGDEVITKDGDLIRKKMSGKDTAWTLAIVSDKRALLRGDPTSRTEKIDQNKLIEALKQSFEDMGKNAKVVSEQ